MKEREVARGEFVLYWMQASQRVEYNHALEYAIHRANSVHLPLLVTFCLADEFPDANASHYQFMLEGLQQVNTSLEEDGIGFIVQLGEPAHVVPEISANAALLVTDRDYLRMQRKWRQSTIESVDCPVYQIESNAIIPIETVSNKEEYSAGTLRPKMQRVLREYFTPLSHHRIERKCPDLGFKGLDITSVSDVMSHLKLENSAEQQVRFHGGPMSAKRELQSFIRNKLNQFGDLRNDPSLDYLSNMSPYLHFGNISPLFVALEIRRAGGPGAASYLEELIVRRELSLNFVYFNRNYDNPECLPKWAKESLELHAFDPREYSYSFSDLEQAKTHDPYWNAAQTEMVRFGKMHGYMRMYWGKKILEWTESHFVAFETALRLNNMYELDGRDPNGYAGVAWCFGKHDRAWSERPIFGKVRYMNDRGLERKFDVDSYVTAILQ